MMPDIHEHATAFAKKEARIFGLALPEMAFLGTFLAGLATAWGDIKEWGELFHPHVIVGTLMQISSVFMAFALGRLKQNGTGKTGAFPVVKPKE